MLHPILIQLYGANVDQLDDVPRERIVAGAAMMITLASEAGDDVQVVQWLDWLYVLVRRYPKWAPSA